MGRRAERRGQANAGELYPLSIAPFAGRHPLLALLALLSASVARVGGRAAGGKNAAERTEVVAYRMPF